MYYIIARRFNGVTFTTSAASLHEARMKGVEAFADPDTASVEIKPV